MGKYIDLEHTSIGINPPVKILFRKLIDASSDSAACKWLFIGGF